MTPACFVDSVASLRFENSFNPYSQICPDHDDENSPAVRRHNLELVLQAAISSGVHSLWIARDLGYRGGRRTGLALTDDVHLDSHAELLRTPPLSRATKGPAVAERTASIVWQILRAIDRPIFLWNVFPLHPHAPGDAMTNRCHSKLERAASSHLLVWLLETLKPERVVAIGRDAQVALDELGIEATGVRHPSYGGQSEFVTSLEAVYKIRFIRTANSQPQFL
jgi:hypothetical protein